MLHRMPHPQISAQRLATWLARTARSVPAARAFNQSGPSVAGTDPSCTRTRPGRFSLCP
jgi:hypothetical protein